MLKRNVNRNQVKTKESTMTPSQDNRKKWIDKEINAAKLIGK